MLFTNKTKKRTGISVTDSFNILSQGTSLTGSIDTKDNILIDCRVRGDITCASRIVVGGNASVEGNVHCPLIEIMGTVQGDIRATELLVLHPTAVIKGNIVTDKLEVHQGAQFIGSCRTQDKIIS